MSNCYWYVLEDEDGWYIDRVLSDDIEDEEQEGRHETLKEAEDALYRELSNE